MNPDGTPITPPANPPADPPKADEAPAWAQQLIDQNADLTTRLSAFEEKLQPPAVEPQAPENPEPWTPKSWTDVDTRAEEKARSIVEDTLAEREKAAKEASDAQANSAAEVDKYLDNQVEELTKANQLPAVTNDNDPNDPGKLAQRELYGFALSLGTADLKTSYNVLDTLHKSGKTFDFVKMELVDKNPSLQGAQSPVGSSNGGGSSASAPITYKDLHNTPIDVLAQRFMN